MIDLAAYLVRKTVVADINQQENILASYRLVDDSFGLTGTEARTLGIDDIGVLFVVGKVDLLRRIHRSGTAPVCDIAVNLLADFTAALERQDRQVTERNTLV